LKSCFENADHKRTPSFGIGDRFHAIKKNSKCLFIIFQKFTEILFLEDVPAPDSYRLKSPFDPDASMTIVPKIAWTFGASRLAYTKVYAPH
jgi:hypothetical protein